MDGFWEPFRFEFFRNGLLVATVAGALCGLVGTFVVLRRMSYIGHGLSHAVFGGAAASAVLGVNFFLGAGAWGVASALLIGRVARRRVIGSDAAIGVVTTASFALGLALFGLYGQARRGTDALLFGSILGVDEADIAVVLAVTVTTVAVVVLGYRPLLFSTFDPEVATVSGLRVDRLDALLMVVLAVAILATTQVLGVVLVAATLVIPATVARMLTNRFARMLWLSTAIGAACGFVGMVASYHLDISSGAAVVLVGAALFVAVFAVTGARGLRRVGDRRVEPAA
ncbi:MAG TPA: metal ABC transporter permease [Acidimicrobiales bacterium]|nr:metal ABC transporter permease [Acidimicrobiales bacterium]